MPITIKRDLSQSDWMTLGPILVALALWMLFKGVRYVP